MSSVYDTVYDVARVPVEGSVLLVVRLFAGAAAEEEEGGGVRPPPLVTQVQLYSQILQPRGVGVHRMHTALLKAGATVHLGATPAQTTLLRDAGVVAARTSCVSLLPAAEAHSALVSLLGNTSAVAQAWRDHVVLAPRRACMLFLLPPRPRKTLTPACPAAASAPPSSRTSWPSSPRGGGT